MSNFFTCPGGLFGAIIAAEVRDGFGTPEMNAQVEAWNQEWQDAGLADGQWATRLADGRLVARNSPEHLSEEREFLSRFTAPDGRAVFEP